MKEKNKILQVLELVSYMILIKYDMIVLIEKLK
jgi:hypothetical protein